MKGRYLTLAMPSLIFDQLVAATADPRETAFFGEVARGGSDDDQREVVLLHTLTPVSDAGYLRREADLLELGSKVFVPHVASLAASEYGLAFAHTHPRGIARPSALDGAVDGELDRLLKVRVGSRQYVSLIVAGPPTAPLISARLRDADGSHRDFDAYRIVGDRIVMLASAHVARDNVPFDRQVRALGVEGQAVLRALRVGVAGAGGTGSAVSEQLIRLGVGEIVVADDDTVDASNVTRIFGAGVADVGMRKVDVVRRNAERIGLGTEVTTIFGRLTNEQVARQFQTCDVIFGCTDDQGGRAVLSRLAYWFVIPTFDLGVLVTSGNGKVREIVARISYMAPGRPCLFCRGRITPEAVAQESLSPEERERLAAEGYVPGLNDPAPSVVTFTSLVSALAATEMLKRLFNLTPPGQASEMLVRIDRGEIRRIEASSIAGHYCEDPSAWAVGGSEPFLGQLWI